MSIVFGKSEATEPVIGEILRILHEVLVVEDIAIPLVSEAALAGGSYFVE
jgi:hypothetical protein